MSEVKKRYIRLDNSGWRNPINDARLVLEEYNLDLVEKQQNQDLAEYIRAVVKTIQEKQQERLLLEWRTSYHYGRLVFNEHPDIYFPALSNIRLDDWMSTIARQAAEEQLFKVGFNRRKYRLGCDNDETAYHVMSACPTSDITARHDTVVYWILRYIIIRTKAPTIYTITTTIEANNVDCRVYVE